MQIRTSFSILAAVLLLMTIGCKSDDADKGFSISGVITGDSPANVEIMAGDQTAISDENGEFKIRNLSRGDYEVRPQKEGLLFVPEKFDISIAGQSVDGLSFLSVDALAIIHGGNVWRQFNSNVYNIVENDANRLRLDLAQNALWYEDDEGGLIYRDISGDFTITATLDVQRTSNNLLEVDCFVCLGGLMARNPDDSNGENYVHVVTGFTPEGLGVETKNTINGTSTYEAVNDGTAEFELQLIRQGSTFTMNKRANGTSDWILAGIYQRADLPATLQVGLNIYTFQTGELADLSVLFRNIELTQN